VASIPSDHPVTIRATILFGLRFHTAHMAVEFSDEVLHRPTREFVESTNIFEFQETHGFEDTDALIERSSTDQEWFWEELVSVVDIEFDSPYETVRNDERGPQFSEWFPGGTLNIATNTVERHAAPTSDIRDKAAVIWEGEPGTVRTLSFAELQRQSNQVANALVARGVEAGDPIALYMPMVPETVSVLYGIFKVGAVAVPIFSGFEREAVATRLDAAEPAVLFTADGFYRRGTERHLKATVDSLETETTVEHTVVFDRVGAPVSVDGDHESWFSDSVGTQPETFDTRSLASNHPSMLLYSSGTTGRPKGIVHTHVGGLIQPAKEIYFAFDHRPDDRFFWVSDIGWMMGPWTLIGNHALGGTVVCYEGAPDYPEPDRYWSLIDDHEVTTFGVSPTAVRTLRDHGEAFLEGHDLSSLRLLGSTGEPWDEPSWRWFYEHVGGSDCPIINISGGTEIMGCFLSVLPTQKLKPCTVGKPGLGMDVDILNESGESVVEDHERGYLVARDSAPSMTQSLWEGDTRYLETYWSRWEDVWNHGDWAVTDEDGFWYILGRADDVITTSGRNVGPAEIEDALGTHEAVSQAGAVGVPDETKGERIVAFVVVSSDLRAPDLEDAVRTHVGNRLGAPFKPHQVVFIEEFPRTQSGKVVRRLLRDAYVGDPPGDLSSLDNPEAVEAIRTAIRAQRSETNS